MCRGIEGYQSILSVGLAGPLLLNEARPAEFPSKKRSIDEFPIHGMRV